MAAATAQKKKLRAPVRKRQGPLPTKATMNLAFHESSFRLSRVLPAAVVGVAALLVFTKLAILNPLDQKAAAYEALGARQAQMQLVTAKLAGYNDLAAQYGRYSYGWMTSTESSLVDRMQVIALIEDKISSAATIADFAVNNNALTVNMSGVTLDQTSAIVSDLESSPLVSSVTVYTAKASDATLQAQVSMTIILHKEAAQ